MPHVPTPPPAFAHAAEEEFAHLLDFYGVCWEYEPRTFVFRADSAGNPIAAFTPDFYLPADLYVEITTMRPKQVRRQEPQDPLAAQQYPEINIKLYKRSDFRKLLAKHGLNGLRSPHGMDHDRRAECRQG